MLVKILKNALACAITAATIYSIANIVNTTLNHHIFYNYIFNTPWPSCVFVVALFLYISFERLYIRYISEKFSINIFFVFRLIPAIQSIFMAILSLGEIFVSLNVNSGLVFFFIGTTASLHYIFSLKILKSKQEKKFDYIYYATGALGLIIMSGYELDANRYMSFFKDRYSQSYEIIMLQNQYNIINAIQFILLKDKNQACQNPAKRQECEQLTNILNSCFQFADTDMHKTATGSTLYNKLLQYSEVKRIINSTPELKDLTKQINESTQVSASILTGIDKLLNMQFIIKVFDFVQTGLIIIIGKIFVAIALAFKTTALSIEIFNWHK